MAQFCHHPFLQCPQNSHLNAPCYLIGMENDPHSVHKTQYYRREHDSKTLQLLDIK
jgi:hypothetical protein